MKTVLLIGILSICYTIHFDPQKNAFKRITNKRYVISHRLKLGEPVPLISIEYPLKQFGAVERSKKQQRKLGRFGCYNPLF